MGEQIQHAFPDARVVKALNTVNASVMVDPATVPGEHDVFLCGDDDDAKKAVAELLASFGWQRDRIRDLGGIVSTRGSEMYVVFWVELMGALGTSTFNISVLQGG
jgi:predicted dinucleotide-binding enzyme